MASLKCHRNTLMAIFFWVVIHTAFHIDSSTWPFQANKSGTKNPNWPLSIETNFYFLAVAVGLKQIEALATAGCIQLETRLCEFFLGHILVVDTPPGGEAEQDCHQPNEDHTPPHEMKGIVGYNDKRGVGGGIGHDVLLARSC